MSKDKDLDLALGDAEVHESQKFDHEDGDSPDFLATPKKGKGVRRLNRLPLLVLGGLILLAVLGITYTFFARQAANVTAKPKDAPPINTVATPPVRPSGNDYVPAAGEPGRCQRKTLQRLRRRAQPRRKPRNSNPCLRRFSAVCD